MGTEPNFFDTPGADGARVPALLGRRRRASPLAAAHRARGRAPQPDAHRPGRAELRDRRRRRDRRRDRGRARRLHQSADPARFGDRERRPAQVSTSSTRRPSCSHRSPTARTSTHGRCSRQRGVAARARHEGRRGARPTGSSSPTAARSSTRTVVWAGGIKVAELVAHVEHPARRRSGRIEVGPDLTVDGHAGRLRARRRRQHARTPTASRSPSSARWRCRPAGARPTTSSPTSPGRNASRSATATRGSWR